MKAEPLTSAELVKSAKSFQTKKKLGQHLLVDANALKLIGEKLGATDGDTIVEIGCGTGFLTRVLASYNLPVVAVDLDRESTVAVDALKLENLRVVHGDFLNFDLNHLALKRHLNNDDSSVSTSEGASAEARSLRVAGNVPYQITGLIIGHILGEIGKPSPWLPSVKKVVLTIQNEVAKRMVASPGTKDYSQLSLLMQYFCQPKVEAVLGSEQFYPPPEVKSAIVSLTPLPKPPIECVNHALLRRIIVAGFSGRRKMLRNALQSLAIPELDINALFSELKLDPQARAENLSLQQFAMIANAIQRHQI